MLEAIIRRLKRLKSNKSGISNVLVVMLSLVLVVVIAANVVLWSFQMNQLDWEKNQENLKITNVERNHLWLKTDSEYTLESGSHIGGTYRDTWEVDNIYETFREESAPYSKSYNPSFDPRPLSGTQWLSGTINDTESDDGVYVQFRSYPSDITNYYVNLTDTLYQTTSTTYTDYLQLTFTAENGAKFFVLGYIELSGSSTVYQAQAQFLADSTVLARYIDRPRVANIEVMPQMFAYIYTGTGNSVAFKWQIATSNTFATASALKGRIYAIRLDNLPNAEYQSIYYPAEVADVNNIWGDASGDTFEITISPQTAGYYLIWASAKVESDSTGSSVSVRLNINNGQEYIPYLIGGESAWSYARIEDTTTAEEHCFSLLAIRQFTAGAHSIKFQIADIDSTPSADWGYISLVAIRLTDVFTFFFNSTVTQTSTTSTTLQSYTTLNIPSGNAGEYLVLGGIVTRGNSTGYSYETALTVDDAVCGRQQIMPKDINDYVPKVFMQNITIDDNDHTVATKYRTLNSAMSVYVKNSDVIAIKLPREHVCEVEFAGTSDTEDWTSLTWTINSHFTVNGVNATVQLYNWQTSEYPMSGDGYNTTLIGTTDVNITQTITVDPTRFRNTTGEWKLKIKGLKATSTPFESWIDWIEIKVEMQSYAYRLDVVGNWVLNLSDYPRENISSVEVHLRFRVSDDQGNWVLKAHRWGVGDEEIGRLSPTGNFEDYVVDSGEGGQNYINPNNGTMVLILCNEVDDKQTTIDIDFFAVRIFLKHGATLTFKNEGASTVHIVSIWVIGADFHRRYNADFFINSGENIQYMRKDVTLPFGSFIVKVVTERGNIAVYSG